MQVTAKIVFYGPGLCGKTTNLQFIHQKTAQGTRGDMVSLETEGDRTLFFDLLPLDVGVIGGMKARLQLYTVPGQVFYNATRKLVVKGVDGVVFVADSQAPMLDANIQSLANLDENLRELGLDLTQVPIVFQYNKRDLRNILSIEELDRALNKHGAPFHEAAARHGIGVFETLKTISRLSLLSIRKRLAADDAARKVTPPVVAAPQPAPAPQPAVVDPAASLLAELGPARGLTAAADDPLGALVPEAPPVEFAEEDTGKHMRAVPTKAHKDIQSELEGLRSVASGAAARATKPTRGGARDVEQRLQDMLGSASPDKETRQEIERKAVLAVPAKLLRGSSRVRVQLVFEQDGQPGQVTEAVEIKLANNKRLGRLALSLELDVKSEG